MKTRILYISNIGSGKHSLDYFPTMKKVELVSYNNVFKTLTIEVSKRKRFVKYLTRLYELGFDIEILDKTTYDILMDEFIKSGYATKRYTQTFPINIVAPISPTDKLLHDYLGKEDVSNGETVSETLRMGGEAQDTETDRLRMGKSRETGSDTVSIPDADTGRPADTGEGSGYSQVALPVEPQVMTIPYGYSVAKYSEVFNVPGSTVRHWIKKGYLRTVKGPKGIAVVNDGSYPWRNPEKRNWQWLSAEEYYAKTGRKPF